MTFSELVVEVAKDAGVPRSTVSHVFHSFSKICRRALMSGLEVRLREFGVFYTVALKTRPLFGGRRRTSDRRLIRFREARVEKYGVVIEEDVQAGDKVKTSVQKKPNTCPKCGATLDGPHHCPAHGTEPFEKKSS